MKKEKFITEIIEIAENAGIEFDQLDEEEPPMSNTKFARKMFELATEAAKEYKINPAIVALVTNDLSNDNAGKLRPQATMGVAHV